jgi:hypothetical protein
MVQGEGAERDTLKKRADRLIIIEVGHPLTGE